MNIAIVGCRWFGDLYYYSSIGYDESIQDRKYKEAIEFVNDKVNLTLVNNNININNIEFVVSGGATGADFIGKYLADNIWNIPTIIHYPDWDHYGKRAGFLRNKLIVRDSNIIFAFWDYKSKGTEHTINLVNRAKQQLFIFDIREMKEV